MKLLIVCAVLACAYATPVYECTRGPSYWCTNIRVAKACGAVDHCIDTVWRHQKVEQVDGDAVCDFCQGVVSQVKSLLLSNETEGRIHSYLTKACALIPDTFMSSKCQEVVDHYEAEIVKMIKAQLDPVVVCEAAGLCMKGFEDHMPRPETRLPLKVGNATDCADCTKFMTDVVAKLTDKSTEKQIISLIEQNVCSQLGAAAPLCNQVVETYADEIVTIITQKVKPGEVCKALGFCNGSRAILVAMKLEKSKLYKEVHKAKANSGVMCTVCQEVLAAVKIEIMQPATQKAVEDYLVNNLCTKLGQLEDECKDAIHNAGKDFFTWIIDELDPPAICKALRLCSAAAKEAKPVAIGQQVFRIVKEPTVGDSPTCTICEFAMTWVAKELKSNATEKEIEAALDKVCDMLPKTVSAECTEFVKDYAPAIVKLLSGELDPKTVCTALGVCSVSSSKHVKSELPKVGDSAQCVMCEFFMNKVESMLADNKTEAKIKQVLDTVCSRLPTTVQSECTQLVDQYSKQIIEFLVQKIPVKEVCTKLGLCKASSKQVKSELPKVAASPQCIMCEFLMKEVDSLLAGNKTEAKVQEVLDKVCSYLPTTIQKECTQLVDQYSKQIFELLVQEMSPGLVCGAIGLCTAQLKPSVRSGIQCEICDLAMTELSNVLKDKATQAEIKQALESVCSQLPTAYQAECKTLVDTYEPTIISILTAELNPKMICKTLALCPAVAIKQVKAQTFTCDYCKVFVGQLQSLLGDKATQAEIDAALMKVCNFLPTSMASQCSSYLDTYYNVTMATFLAMKPNECCAMTGLCAAQKPTVPLDWIRINPLQHSQQQQKPMFGRHSKCLYGPSYWCASPENARRCQAEVHCKKHVWN